MQFESGGKWVNSYRSFVHYAGLDLPRDDLTLDGASVQNACIARIRLHVDNLRLGAFQIADPLARLAAVRSHDILPNDEQDPGRIMKGMRKLMLQLLMNKSIVKLTRHPPRKPAAA